jgi:hypothetical protein
MRCAPTLPQSQLCTFRPFLALLIRPVLVRLTAEDCNDMASGLVEDCVAERELALVGEGRRRGDGCLAGPGWECLCCCREILDVRGMLDVRGPLGSPVSDMASGRRRRAVYIQGGSAWACRAWMRKWSRRRSGRRDPEGVIQQKGYEVMSSSWARRRDAKDVWQAV